MPEPLKSAPRVTGDTSESTQVLKVLLVDDDKGFRELAGSLLGKISAFELILSDTGEDALSKITSDVFDAIVADYSMPGLDGIELMKKVRMTTDIPFIILSGKGNESVIIDALNHGADFYAQKEGDPKVLFSNLANMIRQAHERWVAKRDLVRSEERYRVFVQELPGLSYQGEMNFSPVFFHGPLEDITGYTWEDFSLGGLTWDMIIHPDDFQALEKTFRDIREVPHTRITREYRIVRKDGSIRWVEEKATNLVGEDGVPFRVQGIIMDITDKKSDELRVKDLATIVNSSTDAVYGVDSHGDLRSWNSGAEKLYGYKFEEIVGQPVSKLFSPDRREELARIRTLISSGERVENYDTVHLAKDGKSIEISLTVSRVMDDTRGTIKWSFIGRDISDRKRSERMLIESELKYRTLFDGANDAMYIISLKGEILDGNIASYETLGYSRQELLGLSLTDLDHDLEESSIQPLMDKLRKDGSAFYETVHLTSEGREIPVEISARLVDYGDEPAILAIVRDVSERKMTQEALATVMRSLEELESIVSTSPAMVFRWTFSNQRFVQFVTDNVVQFGYHPSDLISRERPYSHIIHPDDRARVAAEIARFHEENIPEYNLEYRIVSRDGQTRWVDDRTTVRVAEIGMPVIHQGIVIDITGRKEAEDALRLANEKLNLMGTITRHDVANQLSIVLGACALIEDDSDEVSRKKHIEMAREAIKIVSQQLEFAGSYQKAGTKAPEWVHVRLDLLSAMASLDLKGIKVEHNLADLEIWADSMFEKVMLNLLDNSMRHGEEVTKISVRAEKRGDSLTMIMEDDGHGIKPEDKELIFERGYGQHTGLGLFLCREILGITGVRIEETGDYGRGTRFEITVPPGRFRNF